MSAISARVAVVAGRNAIGIELPNSAREMVMLRELLTRIPDLEPAGPAEWLPSTFISGPKHMPVRFTPGARS